MTVRSEAPAAGIWRYADAFEPPIERPYRVSLGEGNTSFERAPRLAAALGLAHLWLKREDRNPTGSHKDRGMAFQVSAAIASAADGGRALRCVALSSSGNAAIAAAAYGRAAGVGVVAFVAPGTDAGKVGAVRANGAAVVVSPNALTLCEAWCAAHRIPNLRPSTDPAAVEGFLTLGWEILSDLRDQAEVPAFVPEALFTFVSSAASFVGIGRAFARRDVAAFPRTAPTPALHAVQGIGGSVAAPFEARPAEPAFRPGRVGALGARKTRRLGEAQRLIRATHGGGWWITDAEADAADELLRAHGVHAALEAAAALAAARRAAAESGIRTAIVVVTGAQRAGGAATMASSDPSTDDAISPSSEARTIEDVDRIVRRTLGPLPLSGGGR